MARVRAHTYAPPRAACVLLTMRERACARVRVDERESRGELRGCGQSDALPQNREGPDPMGIEREPSRLASPRDRKGLNYRSIDATGH